MNIVTKVIDTDFFHNIAKNLTQFPNTVWKRLQRPIINFFW